MKGWKVKDELEQIWKEAIVAYFKVIRRHVWRDWEKHENLNRDSCLRAEILTQDLLKGLVKNGSITWFSKPQQTFRHKHENPAIYIKHEHSFNELILCGRVFLGKLPSPNFSSSATRCICWLLLESSAGRIRNDYKSYGEHKRSEVVAVQGSRCAHNPQG
jgi:hypothetical protein